MKSRKRRDEPVKIGTAEDQAVADVWKAFLEVEGIPCLVKEQDPLAHYWLGPKPFSRFTFDVYVPAAVAERARAIHVPQHPLKFVRFGASALLPKASGYGILASST